ncbi:hypothetical protein AKJ09_04495 [Labilithrix luteola]|uniref:IgGFc-binding protein N-terminal domain-containing protein n=1 Tax=Labilithrix luteola TaxID=1391654 RepID=A0A0K1PWT0_9BACT|nr:hypothetical protein AKJ09_04495 [Labilithrix luteola]
MAALLGASVMSTGCSSDRASFVESSSSFSSSDAAADAPSCGRVCSLDHRSVLDTCTGAVLEACEADRACGAGNCQEPCGAAAADSSSNGCDFYLQPPALRLAQACFAAYVVNTSTLPVDLTLSLGADKIDVSNAVYHADPNDPKALIRHEGPVLPGDTVIVYLSDQDRTKAAKAGEGDAPCPTGVTPATFIEPVPSGTGRGKSFHLTTNAPVGLTSIYPAAGAGSQVTTATLLLPVPLWGKENMIVNAWGVVTDALHNIGNGPTAQIVASKDDTQVTLYPKRAIQGGADVAGTAQGIPVTYQLNRGEVVQFDQSEEFTGSVVVSNNPISIFGGHECALIPSDVWACDYAQQQLPALAQWGSEYAAVGYRSRSGDNASELMPYRVVAAREGTKLDYDPPQPPAGAPLELAAGEIATFYAQVGDAFVVRTQDADHPIYVAAYMTGSASNRFSEGDPEFVNVIPAQQYQNAYSFYADPTYADTSLAIIRRKTDGEFKDVSLDCAGILSDWKPIGVRGEYEWRRVELARRLGKGDSFGDATCGLGLHQMKSDGEFTATVWGWDYYVSYAYPGGTALRNVTTGSFAPVH